MSMLFSLDPFILKALAAGIGVAIIAGVMGCFIVWRRMAYFGDSLSHSALLGIALGLTFNISSDVSIVLVCSTFAFLLVWLQQRQILAIDTLLGILAHAALSLGMVTISFLHQRINMQAYLFGDILTVTSSELIWIYAGSIFVIGMLVTFWSSFVLMTLHEPLAKAEGVNTFVMQLLFMFLTTLVVAVSIRIVGILLITSMLIIPAATARQVGSSPERMAFASCCIGVLSVIVGLYGSMVFDIPTGPSIVTVATILFVAISFVSVVLKRRF